MKDIVKITSDTISLDEIVSSVKDPKAGAISTFSGTTRDNFEDKEVKTLAYEAYIPMAEKSIQSLITEARQKWDDLIHVKVPIWKKEVYVSGGPDGTDGGEVWKANNTMS
ncbi:Molybdopterin synthase catalytic subunit [Modicella reniformis]|uniref:Molybdopterin synthase catalytic subunit n=1 Tax=Modicella reniformis TaxID=1440133 RepID=A0A9P6IH91_9FUNG|nr:Molybdopterin synthase catalytic subunit [Modicella reniformis]